MATKAPRGKKKESAAKEPQRGAIERNTIGIEELTKRVRGVEKGVGGTKGLSDAGVRSPLIIVGEQFLRAKRLVSFLRENLFPGEDSLSAYFGPELTTARAMEPIIQSLRNLSLFSKDQLLVIYEADAIKSGPGTPLAAALAGLSQSFVVLTARALDKRGAMLSDVGGTVLTLEPLGGNSLRNWIEKEARRAEASGIDGAAAELLVRCYGEDLSTLSQEIAKLALLTPPGGIITKDLVREISLKSPAYNSFAVISEIAKNNVVNAVHLSREIVEQGLHPLQVSALLSRAIRTLLAKKEQSDGLGPDLGNYWIWKNVGANAGLFSIEDLRSSVTVLADLDRKLKSSGLEPEFLLSLAVQKLAARRFGARP